MTSTPGPFTRANGKLAEVGRLGKSGKTKIAVITQRVIGLSSVR
jgi:hypothetical protein